MVHGIYSPNVFGFFGFKLISVVVVNEYRVFCSSTICFGDKVHQAVLCVVVVCISYSLYVLCD